MTMQSYPKFDNLEALVKERVCLKRIEIATQERIKAINIILTESIQMLQEALSENFSPPSCSESDMQQTMTKLGGQIKSVNSPPGAIVKTTDITTGGK